MNANRRKAVALCAITRSKLWDVPLDEAVLISLEKAGIEATEANRRKVRRLAQFILTDSDKPGQIKIAI